jgi:transcriptional regulator with PAS, ATPase and Fis domain
VRSVGADREVPIDVRVVAATNRRLDEMVRDRTFREDLFHRLNVLPLYIPPLRERPVDIHCLVEHFITKYCKLWQAKGRPLIASDFVSGLEKSMLPGNARQLENIVRRALVQWEGNRPLSLRDLPPEIWQEISSAAQSKPALEDASLALNMESNGSLETHAIEYLRRHRWNLPQVLQHLESLLVQSALSAAKGKQSEAARLLGISPRSVYNKVHNFVRSERKISS